MGARRGWGLFLLAAVGAALVGCSPVYAGVVGIQRVGDDLAIVVETCPGYSLNAPVQLRHTPADKEDAEVVQHWGPGSDQGEERSFSLGDRDAFVQSLIPGDRYRLWGDNGGPFTAEFIAGPRIDPTVVSSLADGEVLSFSFDHDYVVLHGVDEMLEGAGSDLFMCSGARTQGPSSFPGVVSG